MSAGNYIRTKEIREKMSLAHKGHIGEKNGFFGKKHTIEAREKIGVCQRGRVGRRLGIPCSEETKMKISMTKTKKANFSGYVTSDDRKERLKFRQQIQKLIFERDNYKCQICGFGGDLQVDHIASWAEHKELRFDPENCRTLCAKCHYKLTFNREMPPTLKGWGHNFLQGGSK